MELVNQTLEGLSWEIRLYSKSGVQYTNLLCDNDFDTKAIYDLYTKELGYIGVQVWHNGENWTDSFKKARRVVLIKD